MICTLTKYFSGDQAGMRWAGHAACMGRRGIHTGFWYQNLEERVHLEDPGIDGILKFIFKKWMGGYGLDQSGPG
jgi:hypothetical protein